MPATEKPKLERGSSEWTLRSNLTGFALYLISGLPEFGARRSDWATGKIGIVRANGRSPIKKKLQPGNKPFPQLQFQSIAIALLAACHFSRHPARTTGTETAGTGFLEETAVSFHPVFADIETLQLLFGRNANPDRRFEN